MSRDSSDGSSADSNSSLLPVSTRSDSWREKSTLSTSPQQKKNKFWTMMSLWQSSFNTILLILILVVVLFKGDSDAVGADRFRKVGGDITGFVPEFSRKIVTFQPDPRYTPENATDFFKDETRQLWLDLVPKGLGYLNVTPYVIDRHPDNLPTPLPEYAPEIVYTTSVTHQLHCLYAILEHFNTMRVPNMEVDPDHSWHLGHCFDYLRQGIMCSGDVTLEGKQTTFPEGKDNGSDGWDGSHVCRDWSQVRGFLEDKRAVEEDWI